MWSDLSNAPKDGTPFFALNHDKEVWVARYDRDGRIQYRWNGRHEPRSFEVRQINGEEWLKEDKQFAKDGEQWVSQWTIWSRLYEFRPTHFLPLPAPPEQL